MEGKTRVDVNVHTGYHNNPGEGWEDNLNPTKYCSIQIIDDMNVGGLEGTNISHVAPFFHINSDHIPYPKVAVTNGLGCPIQLYPL
jgi:hypothetical protein